MAWSVLRSGGVTFAATCLMALTGCSASPSSVAGVSVAEGSVASPDQVAAQGMLVPPDGALSLAGPVPAISPLSELLESANALGFVPARVAHDGPWLSIDAKRGTVALMQGADEIRSGLVEGAGSLTSGTFSLQHKQRSALWYATDAYFSSRGLAVPKQGDRSRFLRGALGEFSLFLDKQTPLHSGPFTSSEIGGARIDENLLSQIYYTLNIGDPIEVR